VRLGDGTDESHERVQTSIDNLWTYTGELFAPDDVDNIFEAEFEGPDLYAIRKDWQANVATIVSEATLTMPDDQWMITGGKEGRHTEHLGHIVAEMQYLQRAHPGASW
jgi:ring-1,2-phenylacetyl-CoA epoxidase subunit PaaC